MQTLRSVCSNSVTRKTRWQSWPTGKKEQMHQLSTFSHVIFRCYLSLIYLLDCLPPPNSWFQLWSQKVLFQKGWQLPTTIQLKNFQRNRSGRLAMRIRTIIHSGSIPMLKTTCIFQPLVSLQPKFCNKLLQLSLHKGFTDSESTEGLNWYEIKEKIWEEDSVFSMSKLLQCSMSGKMYY